MTLPPRRGIPMGGPVPQPVLAVTCPWCANRMLHPPGAPPCTVAANDFRRRMIPLADLVAWNALQLTALLQALTRAKAAEDPPPEDAAE